MQSIARTINHNTELGMHSARDTARTLTELTEHLSECESAFITLV